MDNEVRIQNNNERNPLLTKKNPVLKTISKHYGDAMYQICYTEFKDFLLKHGDLLLRILENYFPHSKVYTPDKYMDKEEYYDFISFILSMLPEDEKERKNTSKTPEELLDEAGYTLYECHSEDDIQSFRKYYDRCGEEYKTYHNGLPQRVGDELCTFNGGRLDRCKVFFAVRKDVDQIKRSDEPKRDDEYGTSVMSLQFTHMEPCRLSIKSRYNHNAKDGDPDRTLDNDLDNIIPGLTKAFERKLGVTFTAQLSDYVPARCIEGSDGKFYKRNMTIQPYTYCTDNVVIKKDEITKYPKDHMILMDYFILDIKEKTIKLIDEEIKDSFPDSIPKIEKIKTESDKKGNRIIIINDDIRIKLDDHNRIKEYINPHVDKIGDNFLKYSKSIDNVELPNVKEVGDDFLKGNYYLKSINLDNVRKVGNKFLLGSSISELSFPKLEETGNLFLYNCYYLRKLNAPNVDIFGDDCINYSKLEEFNFPKLRIVGNDFMINGANKITKLDLPNLEKVGHHFISSDRHIKTVNLPNLREAGYCFLDYNEDLEEISLPLIKKINSYFLHFNGKIKKIDLPSVISIGDYVLDSANSVKELNIPNVREIGIDFLGAFGNIESFNVPEGFKINGINAGARFGIKL